MQASLITIIVGVLAVVSAAAPATVERVEGPLLLQASVTGRAFTLGTPVPISLLVRNAGASAVAVTFASGQRYDVVVRRPRGDEVWRWSHDKAFIQVVQTLPIHPGEELAYHVTWDQQDLQGRQVDLGTYEIVAIFLGQAAGVPARGPITLAPLTISVVR